MYYCKNVDNPSKRRKIQQEKDDYELARSLQVNMKFYHQYLDIRIHQLS